MNTDTRLSVIEARGELIRSLVKASIGWTLVLTVAVVGAVLAVNSQFDTLESKFDRRIDGLESKFDHRFESMDRKIDGLQNLILQHITLHPETPDAVVANQPDKELNPTG